MPTLLRTSASAKPEFAPCGTGSVLSTARTLEALPAGQG